MGKIKNDELRKIRNDHFIRAFDHVKNALGMKQGQLAEAIGSQNAYISNFRNGIRPVPDETIEELIRISASKPGLQIYREYLYGNSDIMLLANVTDEDIAEAEMRKNNPDYDIMKQRREESEQRLDTNLNHQPAAIDPSSAANAAIAAYVELTNRLKQEMDERLADKDTIIQEKQSRITLLESAVRDKDALIKTLQRQLADIKNRDILNTPFPIGAAEDDSKFQAKI